MANDVVINSSDGGVARLESARKGATKRAEAESHREAWRSVLSKALNRDPAAKAAGHTLTTAAKPQATIEVDAKKATTHVTKMLVDPDVTIGKHGGDRRSKAYVPKENKVKWGETSNYLVARLKRDTPEIAQALARGEYKSVRAAAVAAGIIKVPTALQQAKRWVKKLDHDGLEQLKDFINKVALEKAPPG